MEKELSIVTRVKGAAQAARDIASVDSATGRLGRTAGVAAAAGTVAFNAMSFAVSRAGDFIGDATQAFIEDEQSVMRLTTSLKANVAGWDGNTKAIEATIKARMLLGFSDEEQRNALALTLTATNDVTQALAIQATAMDLARFKSISLEEATAKLIKIEGGSFRALKELGIEIDENATQTEALIAVQKAAQGQAEAWAETTGGKLVSAQIRAGEATERLGAVFARLGAVILPSLADGLDAVMNMIDGVATEADKAINPLTALLNIATMGNFSRIQDLQIKTNAAISTASPTPTTSSTNYFGGSTAPSYSHADGYLGMASSATPAIYGEAGTEAIAILRNPRMGPAPGGGDEPVVNVNITMTPTVSARTVITATDSLYRASSRTRVVAD